MPINFSTSLIYKLVTCTVVTASLAACGGSGGDNGSGGTAATNANGLLNEAQGCAYLLEAPFSVPAAELNQLGCAYTDENGNVAFWQGTNGNFGPDSVQGSGNEEITDAVTGISTNTGVVDQVAPTTDINTSETSTSTSGITTEPADDEVNVPNGDAINAPDSVVVTTAQPLASELLDNGTGAIYSQAVNSSLLAGAVVGSGELPNSSLYKSIAFTTQNMPADMEILHALAHENGFGDAHMIMHLRNNGNDVRCFVEHGETEAYNAAGTIIAGGLLDFGFVDGSLGVTANGTYTDTCVAPGEIIYISQRFNEDFTLGQIVSVKVSDLDFSANSSVANLAVKPISYTVDINGINVMVANQSSQTVALSSSRLFILTDEGVPIDFDLEIHDEELLPGAETVITHRSRFKGSSTNIRVLLDYDPVR